MDTACTQRSDLDKPSARSAALPLRWAFALGLGLSAAASATQSEPYPEGGTDFTVPVTDGELVDRFGHDGPPEVQGFWRRNGRGWQVWWDPHLATPRFVFPVEPFEVSRPEPGAREPSRELVVRSVEGFIDENAELFGVSSLTLGEPYVYRLLRSWVLVFPETTPGGTAVRGANLRAVVHEDGRLGWIKAFLARGLQDPAGDLMLQGAAEATAVAGGGSPVSAVLELGFPAPELASAAPIWSLWVLEADALLTEHLIDARTGAVLARRRPVRHLDGSGGADLRLVDGTVWGFFPDSKDPFASPWTAPVKRQTLPGVLIRDDNQRYTDFPGSWKRTPLAFTDEEGRYEALGVVDSDGSVALLACLESGHIGDPSNPKGTYWVDFEIQPIELDLNPLLGDKSGEDFDEDKVPDQRQGGTAGTYDFTFYEDVPDEPGTWNRETRSLWLQAYFFTWKMLDPVAETLEEHLGNVDELKTSDFLPLKPVNVLVSALQTGSNYYTPGGNLFNLQGENRKWPSAIVAALHFQAEGKPECKEWDARGCEPTVPTILEHEVAHHIFFNLTGTDVFAYKFRDDPARVAQLAPVEEGVADALVAITNDNPDINFRKDPDGELQPTTLSFSLEGRTGPDFRDLVRVDVGEAFWKLHRLLRDAKKEDGAPEWAPKEPEDIRKKIAHDLLVFWLAHNRVQTSTQLAFDRSHYLAEELLLVDDKDGLFRRDEPPKADNDLGNGTLHLWAIERAFRGRLLFDAKFQRGDPDRDGATNITDAIYILTFLFGGAGPHHDCKNAMDSDGNGAVDLTDAVRLLQYLFLGAEAPPEPFGRCGLDQEPPGMPGNAGCREPWCPPPPPGEGAPG